MQPLFLFSLPRAGSTLAQRILGSHEDISTAAEPWLLLPLLYARKSEGVLAEYDHDAAFKAWEDFEKTLPGKSADMDAALRQFALELYTKAARPGARYFLDKTPRYHLIAAEIMRIFPDVKVIFLWRNPLAVMSSIIETFGRGRWNVYEFKIDLFNGLEHLLNAHQDFKQRAHAMRYEDLVKDSGTVVEKLCVYLDIPYKKSLIEEFAKATLRGRLGDYTGTKEYASISAEPLDKWKQQLCNPLRKRWARAYLHWIGKDRLAAMGYSLDELLAELNALPFSLRRLFSDIYWRAYGFFYLFFEGQLMKRKLRSLRNWRNVHVHR